jgi:hypothetical protein
MKIKLYLFSFFICLKIYILTETTNTSQLNNNTNNNHTNIDIDININIDNNNTNNINNLNITNPTLTFPKCKEITSIDDIYSNNQYNSVYNPITGNDYWSSRKIEKGNFSDWTCTLHHPR